jgi:hypothetical protein
MTDHQATASTAQASSTASRTLNSFLTFGLWDFAFKKVISSSVKALMPFLERGRGPYQKLNLQILRRAA